MLIQPIIDTIFNNIFYLQIQFHHEIKRSTTGVRKSTIYFFHVLHINTESKNTYKFNAKRNFMTTEQ